MTAKHEEVVDCDEWCPSGQQCVDGGGNRYIKMDQWDLSGEDISCSSTWEERNSQEKCLERCSKDARCLSAYWHNKKGCCSKKENRRSNGGRELNQRFCFDVQERKIGRAHV